jgi:hypothetical protein
MNRTVDARDSTPESFSGLLERLTRRGRQGNADPHSASSFVAEVDSAGIDASAASEFDSGPNSAFGSDRYPGSSSAPVSFARPARSGLPARSVLPVTELKPGKNRRDADSMPLSYEKALRMHGRHNRTPDSDLPRADEPREDRHIAPAAARKPAPVRAQTPAEGKRTIQKSIPNTIPNVASARISGSRATKAQPVRQSHAAIPVQAVEQRSAQPAGQTLTQKQVKPPPGSRIAPRANARDESKAPPAVDARCSSTLSSSVQSSAPSQPATHRRSKGKAKPQIASGKIPKAREDAQLERQQNSLQLEHRRAILSIRLSDRESDQLRRRAAESGLSVSAYTRSCVLEAEHLRAQVKQALAEMRTFMGQTEQAGLPALAIRPSANNHGYVFAIGERLPWSRLLAKSAAALLGLWLPFRRGA